MHPNNHGFLTVQKVKREMMTNTTCTAVWAYVLFALKHGQMGNDAVWNRHRGHFIAISACICDHFLYDSQTQWNPVAMTKIVCNSLQGFIPFAV